MGRGVNGFGKGEPPPEAVEALRSGTGRGVRIAVLDSGIETGHPALGGLILRDDIAIVSDGLRLHAEPGNGRDVFGHGTAVAGLIRALAPEAEIGSIRVLGEGLDSRTAVIREGARQAIERGYQILNCSFGCGVPDHVLHYKSWIDEAYLRRVHVVAACNNSDYTRPEWPAHFPTVISVNMTDAPGADTLFYRPDSLVEFLAHGVNVRVPWRESGTREITGSSFAAAQVAGMVARILSGVPELSPIEMKTLLHRLARPWHDGKSGMGES